MCWFRCWLSGFGFGSPWGRGCGFGRGGGFLRKSGEILFVDLGGRLGFALGGWGDFVLLLEFGHFDFGFIDGTASITGNVVAVTVGTDRSEEASCRERV